MNIFLNVRYVVLTDGYLSFTAAARHLSIMYLCADIIGVCRALCALPQVFLYLLFGIGKFIAKCRVLLVQQFYALFRFSQFCAVLLQLCHPHRNFQRCFFIVQHLELFCLFALLFQRTYTPLQFGKNVCQPCDVVLSLHQSALSLLLFIAELCHACGFLENIAPVTALAVYYIGYAPLSDYRIAVLAKTGIHEQFVDIFQPDGTAVYQILTVAVFVEFSRYRHHLVVNVERSVLVVDYECYLRKRRLFPRFAPVKNNARHLLAAQCL